MPVNAAPLLKALQKWVTRFEDDLRDRCKEVPDLAARLKGQYDAAREAKRTAYPFATWREETLTQSAVAWVLSCTFVRFLEDNDLLETPFLSGPGELRDIAGENRAAYFRENREHSDDDYLRQAFRAVAVLPGMGDLFDERHNELWNAGISGDAAKAFIEFWRRIDPDSGTMAHDFRDAEWGTRFLGDLYQDLSASARDRFALLQTPDFVEEFILDRTLEPAIATFGYEKVRLIDPTCGSGHFLLGTLARMLKRWQKGHPELDVREVAAKALDAVYGVDINPFAVAVARFRLLLAVWRFCGVTKLRSAPDFRLNLAVGDSLIHGRRFRRMEGENHRQATFEGEEALFADEMKHVFEVEDRAALHRILGQQYHAVVGNPPYITVKDKALNQLYRARYDACHKQYSLSVPFMERFFDLALAGVGRQPAGFTGQITSNSFTKADFGKKLIEEHIPRWDLTHVIDTSGASIPGHGTPTVILFGRNATPVAMTLRMVMGIKGEPGTPDEPAKGKVWRAIVDQVDCPRSEGEFVSVVDTERSELYQHPWSLAGGGASKIKSLLESTASSILGDHIEDVGRTTHTGDDNALCIPPSIARTKGFPHNVVLMVRGQDIRDFVVTNEIAAIFPYDENGIPTENLPKKLWHYFWMLRTPLKARRDFGNRIEDRGLRWIDHSMFFPARFRATRHIAFSNVSTHNHFGAHSGARLFNSHAPAMQIPKSAGDAAYFRLLAVTNSSVGCFWMKQVFQGKHKGDGGEAHATPEYQRFEFSSTKLKQFPVPTESPLTQARELNRLAQELSGYSPDSLASRNAVSAAALTEAEQTATDLRARMVLLQEELDWQCYRHYGLIDANDDLEWPEDRLDELPPLQLGERTFEIFMARQMARGTFETTWFERHKEAGSKPITEPPRHWPEEYVALYHRRHEAIQSNKNLNLIERPEYKRRWNTPPWAKRQQEALEKWLLTRLEGCFHDSDRMFESADKDQESTGEAGKVPEGVANARKGHDAGSAFSLTTVNRLANAAKRDPLFMEAAATFTGAPDFDVEKLVNKLVLTAAVPFLPALRYKPAGLRKRQQWEETWKKQRAEDAIDTEENIDEEGISDLDRHKRKEKADARKKAEIGDIPVPPKYKSTDFQKPAYWKQRGKLDVPKERFILYPGAEGGWDDSPVIAWAGWDHAQQAQSLTGYLQKSQTDWAFTATQQATLLAGLKELLPWLHQWHNSVDPTYNERLSKIYQDYYEQKRHELRLTDDEVEVIRMGEE